MMMLAPLLAPVILTADDRSTAWLSADGVRQQLEQPVSIRWSGVSMRQAIQNLARSQRVAMVLDRRVDPDQEIELTLSDVTLDTALASVAARLKLGVSHVGPVIYLGPLRTAERLRTLVELRKEELSRLPPATRRALAAQKPCQWEMLSTPRDLLAKAAAEYRVRIEPVGEVPHDLWPAVELPPLGLVERVSLIAAQFDLTFDISEDGRALRLVSMPEQAVLERSYPSTTPAAAIARLRPLVPNCELRAAERQIVVHGPAEEHEIVELLLAGKAIRRTTVGPAKTVYQLNVVAPVGRLIRELGSKLGREIVIDDAAIRRAGLSLEKDVQVAVKNATEDELLHAALEPAGLTYERSGNALVVRPK